jgi:hypothetical protein
VGKAGGYSVGGEIVGEGGRARKALFFLSFFPSVWSRRREIPTILESLESPMFLLSSSFLQEQEKEKYL